MKRLLPIIILFIISFFITKPFFNEGYFPTHDGEWAIVRMAEMQREIKDGQIPPRWAGYLNHGYGYPLFSFTYPLPYYLGVLFHLLHIGLVDNVKTIFILSVFLSAISMFFLGRELIGDSGGFIAAVCYTVAPYRLVNLYVRGSIGESLGLAIFPLLLLLSLKYILKPTLIRLVLTSFVLALFILTHNITAFVFFPFWIIFLYISLFTYFEDIKKYTIYYFPPLIILGLGLSAYFFIPAILEKKYILLSQIKLADISKNFIKPLDFLFSPWSYEKPSFQLGWAHITGAFLGLISIFLSNKIERKKYLYFAIFIIIGIIFPIFFTLSISEKFWMIAPLSWIDFPWRLMNVIIFFLAFSSMFLVIHKFIKIIGILLVLLIIFLSLKFAKPAEYFNKGDLYYATNDATTTSADELMPIWVIDKPKNRYQSKIEVEKGNAIISNLIDNSFSFEAEALVNTTDANLKVNTVYFPGWQFYINGEKTVINYNQNDGLIRFSIPSGRHHIKGKFVETPIRLISDLITLISLIISLSLVCYSLFRKLSVKKS